MLRKGKPKLSVVAEKAADGSEDEDKCFAVSVVHIHGQTFHALLDSGVTPNITSPGAVKKLSLSAEKTSRVVIVASGANSGAVGELMKIPVMFDEIQANLNPILQKNIPFEVVIGRQPIERLGGVLYFPVEVVRFNYRGQAAVVPISP